MPSHAGLDTTFLPPATFHRRARHLGWFLLAVATVVLLRGNVITPLRVASDSMSPTLQSHDAVLVDRLDTGTGQIRRNDLVVFHSPQGGELLLKRVVAIGGDVVAIRDSLLYVNDKEVREPYVDHDAIDGSYFGPVTVQSGDLFLLGDNRANSIDSRSFGSVPYDLVLGRVLIRLWPPG